MRILLIPAVMLIGSFGTVAVAAEGDEAFATADKELNSSFKDIEARIGDDAGIKSCLSPPKRRGFPFATTSVHFRHQPVRTVAPTLCSLLPAEPN